VRFAELVSPGLLENGKEDGIKLTPRGRPGRPGVGNLPWSLYVRDDAKVAVCGRWSYFLLLCPRKRHKYLRFAEQPAAAAVEFLMPVPLAVRASRVKTKLGQSSLSKRLYKSYTKNELWMSSAEDALRFQAQGRG